MRWRKKTAQDVHPISMVVHHNLHAVISRYEPSRIIDVGGNGKLDRFFDCEVVNANLCHGFDGADLPFEDDSFDVATSIATLEHVGDTERQVQFVRECCRVATKASVHWFPAGECAAGIERLKEELGHPHPCILPDRALEQIQREFKSASVSPFVSCSEHLLLLATINKRMNINRVYDFVRWHGNEHYGVILEIR